MSTSQAESSAAGATKYQPPSSLNLPHGNGIGRRSSAGSNTSNFSSASGYNAMNSIPGITPSLQAPTLVSNSNTSSFPNMFPPPTLPANAQTKATGDPHSTILRAHSLSSPSGVPSPAAIAQMAFPTNPFAFQQQFAQHQQMTYERFTADLTNCIIAFLSPILPTEEEYRIKEATRRQLERFAGKVHPGAKLLAFGSMANGFALKNSDMDLCCLVRTEEGEDGSPPQECPSASELVEILGRLIREETDYNVMLLPKARIPIIKISRSPTSELPYDISCDIGFENRLALENTRLLLSYAMVDPPRLRTLVLFLKVWTKRRKLNSPFTGTLSSYGYTLMMIFFLIHIKRPAVLPNLQRIPPSGHASKTQDAQLNGHDIYFYDDVATLRKEWSSLNSENVGELLLDFFRYFSKDFSYSRDGISIRAETGLFPKDNITWASELCIEDPFQSGYNVARTVTKDGLYTIRGEFMRASRILTTRMDRVSAALAELCEEREDGLTRAPESSYGHRHRPMNTAHHQMYLPGGGFNPQYLRDLTRRFDANPSLNGLGGSFAFEEMARGLGQVQRGSAVAFPPTTAMLAPLSQNPGLSPHQNLMRAGLRYDATYRGGPSSANTPSQRMPSSARSEDGGSTSNKRKRNKRPGLVAMNDRLANAVEAADAINGSNTDSGNISAQTSPMLDNGVSQDLLNPESALQGAYGIGEAFAYGSEISFGSQRFQLHPPLHAIGIHSKAKQKANQRASRSFSDGAHRSQSQPPSPTRGSMSSRSVTTSLEPEMASLSVQGDQRDGDSQSATSASSLPLLRSTSLKASPHRLQSNAVPRASASPSYLTSSPWTFLQSNPADSTPPEESDDQFALDDDEQESLSEDTLDELARISAAESLEENGCADEHAREEKNNTIKNHDVRSWAASLQDQRPG